MDYERKFAGLLQLCEEARSGNLDVIVIHHPEVLGDTYDELIESLNRIADCGLRLAIPPRAERPHAAN